MSPPSGIITLTTDFGLADPYAGIVKGVILGRFPGARIVDLTHQLPPQDVRAGAWALLDAVPHFPAGTVHLAVVDPGVGSDRRPIALFSQGHFFVGPDNGVFSAFGPGEKAVVLDRPEILSARVSSTFHARDIFAPAAAALASGRPLHELGGPIDGLMALPLPRPVSKGDSVIGEVVQVDRFGNLITNIPASLVPEGAARVRGRKIDRVLRFYGEARTGALIALISSGGRLEIAVVNGSAAKRLKDGVGGKVEVLLARPGGRDHGARKKARRDE